MPHISVNGAAGTRQGGPRDLKEYTLFTAPLSIGGPNIPSDGRLQIVAAKQPGPLPMPPPMWPPPNSLALLIAAILAF